jgi:MFS family permease
VTYRTILSLPGVAALLAAMTLSRLAGRMHALALVLYALERFGSSAVAGWLTFAAVAPGLAVSPLAGTVLDRFGAAAAVGIDLGASAALLLAIVAVGLLGWDGAPVLFVLAALYSLTTPLGVAGVRVILPRLVPPEALDAANGADTAINAAVGVLGPAVAGLLVALVGGPATLAVIAGVALSGC